ncbi:FAD binding domain-containing protein [Achaetomium macrosporum]|uniref:FAD binding domain-containing protein n=1 Tax=Achaetomium macrosporum TaxID=79813 RepID=A0AAN7CBI7_9PEZI|nr:FAD binding domain-containing protein [Achaetomium macrosporum]
MIICADGNRELTFDLPYRVGLNEEAYFLALANWFRDSNIKVLLVNRKSGPTLRGQAEGVKSTTNEICASFGIGPQIAAESWRFEEIAVWGSKGDGGRGIVREQVVQDKVEELGTIRETMLQQSEQANGVNGHGQVEERIRAKYVVGCDGAHSWLRKQLDVALEGDLTDSVFGVVDLVPKTDFPDIRRICYLRAATGTILLVPRGNKEVRLYIPVESGSALPDPKDLTLDRIMATAREIMAPYTLEPGSVSWWSAYRVGQRVGSHFSRCNERAFLVGDAVHTHSPKAGQGMNTSIQDAYNLGWKLRLVLQGHIRSAREALLNTYESERRPVAQDLIAFDRGYLKLFSAPLAQFDTEFLRAMKFTTGLSIRYPPSCAVQLPRGVEKLGPSLLKADLVPGKRLQDVQVVYQADAIAIRTQERMQANGMFRIAVFAGDIAEGRLLANLQRLGEFLADQDLGLGRLTMSIRGDDSAAWSQVPVEVLVIHCAERECVNLLDLHEVYRPWSSDEGYDYWRVFADAESVLGGHGRVYERLEIDRQKGCCAVIRPDGYVGAVLDTDDFQGLKDYFEGLGMLESEDRLNSKSQ